MMSSKGKPDMHKHTPIKTPDTKPETIFLLQTTRLSQYLKGLSSSLTQPASKLRLAKFALRGPIILFVQLFYFCRKLFFLSHNFGFSYVKKLIKDSKNMDFSLVSNKNFSQKIVGWISTQGQVN